MTSMIWQWQPICYNSLTTASDSFPYSSASIQGKMLPLNVGTWCLNKHVCWMQSTYLMQIFSINLGVATHLNKLIGIIWHFDKGAIHTLTTYKIVISKFRFVIAATIYELCCYQNSKRIGLVQPAWAQLWFINGLFRYDYIRISAICDTGAGKLTPGCHSIIVFPDIWTTISLIMVIHW